MAAFHAGDAKGGEGDQKTMAEMMRSIHGPAAVDDAVRRAVQTCWMMLPEERRTVDEVEREIRRVTERALESFRDDAKSFP